MLNKGFCPVAICLAFSNTSSPVIAAAPVLASPPQSGKRLKSGKENDQPELSDCFSLLRFFKIYAILPLYSGGI